MKYLTENAEGRKEGYEQGKNNERELQCGKKNYEKDNIRLEKENEQLKNEIQDYQFNYDNIKELSKENAELKKQIEKMKRCFNCSKWFNNTELCVSNERGTSLCDKWELAE